MTDKIEKMTDDDFKKIMQSLGMPDSMSLYAALKQVENHTWQAAQSEQAVPVEDVVLPIANAYESGIGHCNDNLCNPYKAGSAEAYAYDYGKEFGKSRATEHSVGDAIPQDWKGVDGAIAWHLIDRHGEGWGHIGDLMNAWLRANTPPNVAVVGELNEDIAQLMKFYAVNDLLSLVRVQSEHVARLQKKLPPMRDEQPRNPRSGGE